MTYLRTVIGIGLLALLALVLGCSPNKVAGPVPIPTPKVAQAPSTTAPGSLPLAQPKSIKQAKAIDSGAANGPRLAIDVEAIDYGDVPFDTVVAFSFNLKNVGTAPIALEPAFIRVKEGC